MPELADSVYCPEQICIPATFPYLLRQFAKAAIRSQPTDLLRWSTAYFKCLSLNIPPPVKTRLEYPIPQNYFGITPGWLKALLRQLENTQTVPFKVLWDRWIGACLQHNTLIQILCLGGFADPFAIPWLQFVALCAAHLTENLTTSMILICEILTDEPEGGSSMINAEVFIQLYEFLAAIDASKPQILKNRYFLDSLLDLWQERVGKLEKIESKIESSVELENVEVEEEQTEEKKADKVKIHEVISCPSLASETEESLLKDVDQETSETSSKSKLSEKSSFAEKDMDHQLIEYIHQVAAATDGEADETASNEEINEKGIQGESVSENIPQVVPNESVDTIITEPTNDSVNVEEDQVLKEDLEKLKKYQEQPGETDDELEKFKCKLIEDMPMTKSMESAVGHFGKSDDLIEIKEEDLEKSSETTTTEETFEDVYVNAIPGIGPIVPEEYVEAVREYARKMSALQHGMFMPRNIRHFNCPPLEIECKESDTDESLQI